MENPNTIQSLADFAVLVSIGSFIVGISVLVAFFLMASNVGTITRIIKEMRMDQIDTASSLRKLAGIETQEEKERKFDEAIRAAKNREHSKI